MGGDPDIVDWLHERWHVVAALLMDKLGVEHVVISAADVKRLPPNMFLTVQELPDGIHLRFVDAPTADAIAREEEREEEGIVH